jgi:Chaperonin 10 Kd subunit
VLFAEYRGSEIKFDGEELLIMREDEIFGIVERAGAMAHSGGGKKGGKQLPNSLGCFIHHNNIE